MILLLALLAIWLIEIVLFCVGYAMTKTPASHDR
jgi:hypothetical protein